MSSGVMTRAQLSAVAALVALSLVASMFLMSPVATAEERAPEIIRVDGRDRFDTAARVAALTYPDGVTDAVLAAGFNFPDALAASGLGGAVNAPVLLVNDVRETATADTIEALVDLAPDTIHIAGGGAAVSAKIEEEVAAAGPWTIKRYAGANRYGTAAQMASAMADAGEAGGTAVVATGRVAADSLAAGPLAHFSPHPILLTEADRLPRETADALTDLAIDSVVVLGGEAAVSLDVVDAIESITGAGSVTRLVGESRFATAVEIADASPFAGGHRVLLATGFGPDDVPADALSGGPHGGVVGAELLPMNDVRDELPPAIAAYLRRHADGIDEILVLGGTAAVSDAVVAAAAEAATSEPTEEPTEEAAIPVVPGQTRVVDTGGQAHALSFMASDLQAGRDYAVALFACGGESSDAPIKSDGQRYPDRDGQSPAGAFTFRDQDLDDRADDSGSTQNGEAQIVTVFQQDVEATQTTATANDDGEIEFTVGVPAGHRGDCAVPVVWADDGPIPGHLDLDADSTDSWNTPAEDVGVGGAVVFHNGEAPAGTHYDDAVLFVDVYERWMVLGDGYLYEWGVPSDDYRYQGAAAGPLTRAGFERYLSVGDSLDVQAQVGVPYSPSGGNVWQLVSDVPGTPVDVQLEQEHNETYNLQVSWDFPKPLEGNVAEFHVELLDADDRSVVGNFSTAPVTTLLPFDAVRALTIEDVHSTADYVARVHARTVTGNTGDWSMLSDVAQGNEDPPEVNDTVKVVSQLVDYDAPTVNMLDTNDRVVIEFDQEMQPLVGSSVQFRWDDGSGVYQVGCTTKAGCTWGDASGLVGNLLTVEVLSDDLLFSGTPGTGLDISGEGPELVFVSDAVRSIDGLPVDIVNNVVPRLSK